MKKVYQFENTWHTFTIRIGIPTGVGFGFDFPRRFVIDNEQHLSHARFFDLRFYILGLNIAVLIKLYNLKERNNNA